MPHTIDHRWLQSKGLKRMEVWPPQSPDLNPIEHVWDILEAKLECYNLREQEERIKEEWSIISANDVQNLISSMPRHITAVIKAKVDIQNIKTLLNT